MSADRHLELLEKVSLMLAENGYVMDDLLATGLTLDMYVLIATCERGAIPGVYVAMTSEYFFLRGVLALVEASPASRRVPAWQALRRHQKRYATTETIEKGIPA